MHHAHLILALGCSLLPLAAAPHPWKDPAGTRTIQGEFISRDARHVTIRRTDGLVFTLDLKKVHPDDLKWLDANHPLPATQAAEPSVDNTAVFDALHFGDTRQQVLAKLKASKIVELSIDETYLGRLGLNGTFQTRKDLGGLRCMLFFDWSEGGLMREVSLQTQALPAAAYPTRLKACLDDFAKLLTTLYGPPLQNATYPPLTDLTDGAFLATHLWRLEGGGSALLGSARENEGYMTVVRFTQKEIQPVRVPIP
ncbi:MAG: hypothetical protein NTW21_39385 [Verrucomicrobia bacterium]|nr:hypothetical protein [Verrucomicrobiota bacterium]